MNRTITAVIGFGAIWLCWGCSPKDDGARHLPVDLQHEFGEPASLEASLKEKGYVVIYRFFMLSTDKRLRSFVVSVRLFSPDSPLNPRSGEFEVKIAGDTEPIRMAKGELSSQEVEDLVTQLYFSEIFSLAYSVPTLLTDDGGAYVPFKHSSDYTLIFERTMSAGVVIIRREDSKSYPADKAAAPFIALAERVFEPLSGKSQDRTGSLNK